MNKIRYKRLEDFERKRQSRKVVDEHLKQQQQKDSDNSSAIGDHYQQSSVKGSSDEQHEKLYKVFSALEKTSDPTLVTASETIVKVLSTKPQPMQLLPSQENHQIINEPIIKAAIPIKTKNKIFHRIRRKSDISEDYESSTALSSSSRDGDFDEIDDSFFDQPIEDDISPSFGDPKFETISTIANEITLQPPKMSWWQKFFRKTPAVQKITPPPLKPIRRRNNREPNGNISLYRLFFIESRQVWQELVEDYPDEWEATKVARNRSVSNLIILIIFCGFGGMIFRFVEGSFESFYKCGVRRVKRDFVDNLWLSSHNLRFHLFRSFFYS